MPIDRIRRFGRCLSKGHEGAFNHIYSTYFRHLFAYGYKCLPNAEVVKDCIQDLFIDLRRSANSLADTDSIQFYLVRAIRNKVLMHLRKSKKEVLIEQVDDQFNFGIQISTETKIINKQINDEMKQQLSRGLENLTKRQKEAIFYFYQEGFSYQQVAEVMDLQTTKSARNIIYKAIESIKKAISKDQF